MAGPDIGEHTAGQTLHGDKAHARRLAFGGQIQIPGTGDVAEGELQGLEIAGGDAVLGDIDPVGGDADVVDPAPAFGLQGAGVSAVGILRIGDLGHLVELEQIDMVGAHHFQTVLDMRQDAVTVLGGALGGEHDLIAHVAQGQPDFLLAVGVEIGGVEVADTAVIGGPQKLHSLIQAAALNGKAAHGGLGDHQAGPPQGDAFHRKLLLRKILKIRLAFFGSFWYNTPCS